ATQGELGLCKNAGERRAELVRELGREAALAPQTRRQPVEEAVERRRELGELVVRRTEREPVVEVVFAPRCGLARHPDHRTERSTEEPPADDADEDQHER